jgi:hypothetical protein
MAASISSCTKPVKDTTPLKEVVGNIPQASKSVPISCKFNGNNTDLGCANKLVF